MRICCKILFQIFIGINLLNIISCFAVSNLTGAGGTFSAPVYEKWAAEYQKITGNQINYQGIGSSGGIKQVISRTVDFGASDIPMKNSELRKNNLFQFPSVIGGIVLIVNIPGISPNEMILNGRVVSDIYLGKIKNWNDPAIVKLNKNIRLPNLDINVVRRADSSGTSYVFTSYLSKVNREWKEKIGKGNIINWPTGLGGKGNNGVAFFVQRLIGSIGYVEYAYAKKNNLVYTKLLNANNKIVSPNEITFGNAANCIDWKSSFVQNLVFQKGDNTWPITSSTFVFIHRDLISTEKGNEVLKFFEWAYRNGNKITNSLYYANLPSDVVKQILINWKGYFKNRNKRDSLSKY